MLRLALLAGGLAAAGLLVASERAADPLPAAVATEYLAQANCVDATGGLRAGVLPFEAGCERRETLRAGGAMAYRKHDWPAVPDRAAQPLGYQASDAWTTTIHGLPAVVQGFDYGGGRLTFGAWDQGLDGGDGVVLEGDRASIALTEDPVSGAQWWNSDRCNGRLPIRPGWLLFEGRRGEAVAPNVLSASPLACARWHTLSLTRWHEAAVPVPWLLRGATRPPFAGALLISEHFTHPTIAASNAMERFFFARGLGKIRWERWENLDFPGRGDAATVLANTARLTAAGSCPEIGGTEHPDRGGGRWRLTFCRMWTNFDPAPAGRPFTALDWPVAAANR